MIRLNRLRILCASGIRIPLLPGEIGSVLSLKLQISHRYRLQEDYPYILRSLRSRLGGLPKSTSPTQPTQPPPLSQGNWCSQSILTRGTECLYSLTGTSIQDPTFVQANVLAPRQPITNVMILIGILRAGDM